jgi:hypothetical protein
MQGQQAPRGLRLSGIEGGKTACRVKGNGRMQGDSHGPAKIPETPPADAVKRRQSSHFMT